MVELFSSLEEPLDVSDLGNLPSEVEVEVIDRVLDDLDAALQVRLTLFGLVRKIVQPDDKLDVFELVGAQVVPVRCGSQGEIVFFCKVAVEGERLQGEIDVVLFTFCGVERDSVEWRTLRRLLCRTGPREENGQPDNKGAENLQPMPPELIDVADKPRSRRSET